jgi:glycerate 2-kinase
MSKPLHSQALKIFKAALRAADPEEAILRHVTVNDGVMSAAGRKYRLDRYKNIFVVGGGKAGAAMAHAVEQLLGRRISGGVVNVKYGHTKKLRRIELVECGHPVPDEAGVGGARRIAEIAAGASSEDLVLCLISGGASALMPAPVEGISLAEKQAATRILLECGADIGEINCIRKHISTLKGGQLARLAAPAAVLALMLSDVIGDDLSVIGSGPTTPDPSTFAMARGILEKYGAWERTPGSVRARIEQGCEGKVEETPKQVTNALNLVVGSNKQAVNAAVEKARELGFRPLVLSTTIEGETRDVARMHAAIAREVMQSGRPVRPPCCIVSGGETTVTIRGDGLGGRNQEFALAAAIDLAGAKGVAVLSGGTDGTDGPTDAAGAIADGQTIERASKLGLRAAEFLARNDSYRFFEAAGGLIKTGPTNTNVMDIRLMLITAAPS